MKRAFSSVLSVLLFSGGIALSAAAPAVFDWYAVPALSPVKRLPDKIPEDGVKNGPLNVILAKGEFEPASFVVQPLRNVNGVRIAPTDLKDASGHTIPASAVDVKVVKVWVQTGCAWYSYFADSSGRELVPELLLNDETLVKVDEKNLENYLRTDASAKDGKQDPYVWISNPKNIDVPFDPVKEGVRDADTLQSVRFEQNRCKQFWVTVEAPGDAVPGLYKGGIDVVADGKKTTIPLHVRVLPFELPQPRTNYDPERIFYTSSYNASNLFNMLKQHGGDLKAAEKRLRNEYDSMRRHNLLYPLLPAWRSDLDLAIYRSQLEIYRQAGLGSDALFDAVRGIPDYSYLSHKDRKKPLAEQTLPSYWEKETGTAAKIAREIFGPDVELYGIGWDEPGMSLLRAERLPWKSLHQQKVKTFSTAHKSHRLHAGYNEDFVNYGGSTNREEARKWHEMGARISAYANPHTGPENPDFVRRTHGFLMYFEDQDGSFNYMLNGSSWNDFLGADYNFRSFNWVYPAADGFVETIQYEGFREAVDDVRYATLLKQTATEALNKAAVSGNVDLAYVAKCALLFLAEVDYLECDLHAVRLEIIRHILKLRDMMNK